MLLKNQAHIFTRNLPSLSFALWSHSNRFHSRTKFEPLSVRLNEMQIVFLKKWCVLITACEHPKQGFLWQSSWGDLITKQNPRVDVAQREAAAESKQGQFKWTCWRHDKSSLDTDLIRCNLFQVFQLQDKHYEVYLMTHRKDLGLIELFQDSSANKWM